MTTYYVATLASYALVDAESDVQARDLGRTAIANQRADGTPIEIRTVRPATPDEIEFSNWHGEMVEGSEPHRHDPGQLKRPHALPDVPESRNEFPIGRHAWSHRPIDQVH